MIVETLQILWHEKNPVFSVDFHPFECNRFASCGGDNDIKLWDVIEKNDSKIGVEFIASLSRHSKSVNCVRFSPNGKMIASGGDDGEVYIWKFSNLIEKVEFDNPSKENWTIQNTFRHLEDVYDLNWSPDSKYLITGSTDNVCSLWDVTKGKRIQELKGHSYYVQGVTFDPRNKFLVTQSNDRTCRIYKTKQGKKKQFFNIGTLNKIKDEQLKIEKREKKKQKLLDEKLKEQQEKQKKEDLEKKKIENSTNLSLSLEKDDDLNIEDNYLKSSEDLLEPKTEIQKPNTETIFNPKMYADETLNSFFRRPSWSTDGSLLITPAGLYKSSADEPSINTAYIFTRNSLLKPIGHLGGALEKHNPVIGIKFNPKLWKLKDSNLPSIFNFKYRMIFAVFTVNNVLIYDTQHLYPISMVGDLHYASLTDVSWSNDGLTLILSSTDGYCSLIRFQPNQLGQTLEEDNYPEIMKEISNTFITEPLVDDIPSTVVSSENAENIVPKNVNTPDPVVNTNEKIANIITKSTGTDVRDIVEPVVKKRRINPVQVL